eukprot:6842425-Pyramimonas_sp.AAC.1
MALLSGPLLGCGLTRISRRIQRWRRGPPRRPQKGGSEARVAVRVPLPPLTSGARAEDRGA